MKKRIFTSNYERAYNLNKYNGLLIHQSYDDNGLIEVVDTKGIRCLHFGNETLQSCFKLSEPNRLMARYTQTLMSWLLFKPPVDEVLMIGLGGGSLANYFLYHFENCQITAIEYRHSVLKVARSHFGLPLKDPRLTTLIADGCHYVQMQSLNKSELYPLIIVDAFDDQGICEAVTKSAFFDNCKQLLKIEGLLVINLWKTDRVLYENVSWNLQQVFNGRVLFLPVRGRGNVIAFAFNEAYIKQDFMQLVKQAQKLQQYHLLDFPLYLKDLRKNNVRNFKNIMKI